MINASNARTKNYAWVIPLGFALYWTGLLALSQLSGKPVSEWLVHLGIPALKESFSDARLVGLWCEEQKTGQDPYRHPPVDGEGRVLRMNYPPLFFAFGFFGLRVQNIPVFGIFLGIIFILSVTLLAGSCSLASACVWVALVCSPVCIFVCERGNFDILVFALLAAAVAMRFREFLAGALVVLAAALKLFPVVGLAALFLRSRRGIWSAFCGVVCFGGYLIFIFEWLPFIFGSLSSNVSCAFGASVLPNQLGRPEWAVFFKFGMLIAGGIACLFGFSLAKSHLESCQERSSFAAGIGLPIFGALVLNGVQFDYKLIFLLFAVPAAIEVVNSSNDAFRTVVRIWGAAFFIYAYWMFFSGEACLRNFLLKQFAGWALYLLSCCFFGLILKPAIARNRTQYRSVS
ncbi:MAG: glycosyltransferase 87 family protein [bacterium]